MSLQEQIEVFFSRKRERDGTAEQKKQKMLRLVTIAAECPAQIKTTRLAGGLLFGYNPRKAGARLKTPAFTLFRPYCP